LRTDACISNAKQSEEIATVAVDDAYKFIGSQSMAGQVYQSSFAFRRLIETDVTPAELAALAESIKVLFRPQQHSSLSWTTWQCNQLWGSGMSLDTPDCTRLNGRVFAGVFASPVTGAVTSYDALPPQCALVTTLTSGIAGRRKRGRNYMTGLVEDYQAGGTWAGVFISTQQAAFTVFLNKYGAAGTDPTWRWGIWSERVATGCVPNTSGDGHTQIDTPHPELAFTTVSGYICRTTVKNQRRRSLGVGR
jgi:hypothetical protein